MPSNNPDTRLGRVNHEARLPTSSPSALRPPPSAFQKLRLFLKLRHLSQDKAMIDKLKSRKLWVAVLGAALVALLNGLGLSSELVNQIVALLATYIGGQSLVDAFAKPKS